MVSIYGYGFSVGGLEVTVMRWGWVRGERWARSGTDWTDLDICAGFKDGISADHGGWICAVKCTLNVERRESVELSRGEDRKLDGVLWLRDSAQEEEEREGWQTSLTAFSP